MASDKKRNIKIAILVFLTFFLGIVSVAAYVKHQYNIGRQESLRLIDETKKNQQFSEVEFQADEIPDEYIHVLLVGIDTSDEGPARTDTIMIAQYHPKKGTAKLVSLMRDSYVEIPGYRNNKINSAFFFGGPELLRQTIKENFHIDLHYYSLVDFKGFERIVDIVAPDGIEVDIQRRMFYRSGKDLIDFQPGVHTLDGQEVLNYVRFRSDHENDFGRVRRQQEVLSILKDELLTLSGVSRLPRLVGAIEPYIHTNVTNRQMLDYGRSFFLNPVDEIQTLTIPVQDGYSDATFPHAGMVLELDLAKNRQALWDFLEIEKDDVNIEAEEEA